MSQKDNIDWFETDKDLSEVYHRTLGASVDSRPIALQLGNDILDITTSSQEFRITFRTVLPKASSDCNRWHFYHIDNLKFENLGCHLAKDRTVSSKPAIGLYNPSTLDILVVEQGSSNYGLLNAMVLGFLSRVFMRTASYQYAHAACIKINEKGLLIIGDHGAGKSTLALAVLKLALQSHIAPSGLVTDDWVLLRKEGNDVCASRLSQEFRIAEAEYVSLESPHSPTSKEASSVCHYNDKEKVSTPIERFCKKVGCEDIYAVKIDIVIILDPQQESYVQRVRKSNHPRALEILSASAANVPPLTSAELNEQNKDWSHLLATYPTFCINNRHPEVELSRVARTVLKITSR